MNLASDLTRELVITSFQPKEKASLRKLGLIAYFLRGVPLLLTHVEPEQPQLQFKGIFIYFLLTISLPYGLITIC